MTVCEPDEAVGACWWEEEDCAVRWDGRRWEGRGRGEAGAAGCDMISFGVVEGTVVLRWKYELLACFAGLGCC